ncbi:dihydrodipicolinate synthase family protein [Jannaschia ovalis]|uniref:Dihydrodipicolinate synthase family protein n=1 Tax=Jannaschia ovalis TaxID=3038773 RepID=A0ABY8LCV1_9RHOB|nr:dihydrodipicolinate synthase family protein [Jannaschia sp. GRR-S6-38]WGH77885.1 dihydrodipicolinate synthase family protein [Jannaschia sp. GRR-S6-38]
MPNPAAPFTGLSAFPVTPTDGAGRVATDRLQALVARIAETKPDSIGVLGSTGGYVYLDRAERARAAAAAVAAANGIPVLCGIGALTTREVLAHAEDAARAGAAGLLLAPVAYLPLTEAEVGTLVADTAAATERPICLYNNPTTTGFTFSERLIAELSRTPGVAAVKNPAPADGDVAGQLARLRAACAPGFALGYSGDATIARALAAGTDAWYSVLAGTLPELAAALWAAREDAAARAALDARLAPLWDLARRHGMIRLAHAAVDRLGLGPAPLPRPLLPLPLAAAGRLAQALAAITRPDKEPA